MYLLRWGECQKDLAYSDRLGEGPNDKRRKFEGERHDGYRNELPQDREGNPSLNPKFIFNE